MKSQQGSQPVLQTPSVPSEATLHTGSADYLSGPRLLSFACHQQRIFRAQRGDEMAAYSLKFLLSILTAVHPVLGEYRKHSSILEASEGVQDWIVETRRWVPPTI